MNTEQEKQSGGRHFDIPEEEILSSGHLGCPGCGGILAIRLALKGLGRDSIFVIPACCMAVVDGPFPMSAIGVPMMHTAFETAASTAAGVRAALTARGNDHTTVVAWAGDGATFDIGFQALSASAVRNDDFLYVCYDNEAYMNTGVQQSSATPTGAKTTTSLRGAGGMTIKKDIGAILAAHRIPYLATATPAFPGDLIRKFEKARAMSGFRFIHVLAPCPPGHKFPAEATIRISRLAVESGLFPLYEAEGGRDYTLSRVNEPDAALFDEYLSLQGRFSGVTEEETALLLDIARERNHQLMEKAGRSGGKDE